tara:strand:- start:617 stop:1105 length:489 start_codon:yes stop_codon:yes gene_type:complete
MSQIARDKVVQIHYTLTLNDGGVIDSSEGQDPLAYLHGHQNIIPGLEEALEGKAVGDALKVSIPPEKGYGERNPQLVQIVPSNAFQGVDNLEVGMIFQAPTEDGSVQMIRIVKLEGENVTIDGNHELAGQTLNFDVKIDAVRDPSPEELTHGHVHGPGGHQH